MIQWDMIQEGDRLLLGLSGGKDSLSLLHCLLEFQKKLPIKFDIEVGSIFVGSHLLVSAFNLTFLDLYPQMHLGLYNRPNDTLFRPFTTHTIR